MKTKLATCVLGLFAATAFAQTPVPPFELEPVSQVPSSVPQRTSAIAFDGKKLWVAIYAAGGSYITYDPVAGTWDTKPDPKLREAIAGMTGRSKSATGMVFIDGKMWVASPGAEQFGSIDIADPAKTVVFGGGVKSELRPSFADLTYDGTHLRVAWHSFDHPQGAAKTQCLLKLDPQTGTLAADFPLPAGNSADGAHGLAWDGTSLWHAKGNKLTRLDRDGKTLRQFDIPQLNRPSGLAWDGRSLWIVEFGGKLWKLTLKNL